MVANSYKLVAVYIIFSLNNIPEINAEEFNATVKKLRSFFLGKGFLETFVQNRLQILAACEDPRTIATFNYAGNVWPLPQTGQMHLEYELLKHPERKGLFCLTTSYRQEPNPIAGRHDLIFPMFEFEMHGNFSELLKIECGLLEFLGYGSAGAFPSGDYLDVAKRFGVRELSHEHESRLYAEEGSVFFLTKFPSYTSPFWNMNNISDIAMKCDVILSGMETIGSAERSTDPNRMRELFYSISEGDYASTLFQHFGRERVSAELEDFLSLNFFPRSGGGIGMTRLIKSLKIENLL